MSSVVVRPEVDLATLLTNRELRVRLLGPENRYVRPVHTGGKLVLSELQPGAWETFRMTPVAQIALCTHEGRYLCAEGGGGGQVVADRLRPLEWELFSQVPMAPGHVALRAATGQYLCAEPDGRVSADRQHGREWETFERIDLGVNRIALRTAHGKYLCVEPGGRVVADRDHAGPWETFLELEVPVPAVRLEASRGFVRLDAKDRSLIARASAEDGEAFRVVPFGDDRIALRTADGRFVCAEGGGGGRLIADRDVPREWETFTWIQAEHPEEFTLRAHNGRSLGVDSSGAVRADRVADPEALKIHIPSDGAIPLYLKAFNDLYVGAEDRLGEQSLVADRPEPRLGEELSLFRAPAIAGSYHLGVNRRWVKLGWNRELVASEKREQAIPFAIEGV